MQFPFPSRETIGSSILVRPRSGVSMGMLTELSSLLSVTAVPATLGSVLQAVISPDDTRGLLRLGSAEFSKGCVCSPLVSDPALVDGKSIVGE